MLPRPTLPLPPLALKRARHCPSHTCWIFPVTMRVGLLLLPSHPTRLPSSKCSPPPWTLLSSRPWLPPAPDLQFLQQPGAGAWLQARPAKALGLTLEPSFFRVLLLPVLRRCGRPLRRPCSYVLVGGTATSATTGSGAGLHGPAVFDLAVTSGLRCGASASSAADGSHAPMLVPLTSTVNARTLTRPPSASNRGYSSCP